MKFFNVYLGRTLWGPQEKTTEDVSRAKPESTGDIWAGPGRWLLSWTWKVTDWRRQWTSAKVVRESSRTRGTKCFEVSILQLSCGWERGGWKRDNPQGRKHWEKPVKGLRCRPTDTWISSCGLRGARVLVLEACKHGVLSDFFSERCYWLQMSLR